jgi:hypothetical protein
MTPLATLRTFLVPFRPSSKKSHFRKTLTDRLTASDLVDLLPKGSEREPGQLIPSTELLWHSCPRVFMYRPHMYSGFPSRILP